MKKFINKVLNYEEIMTSFIGAIGYGVGFIVPKFNDLPTIVCIICSFILGTVFDNIAAKILGTKSLIDTKKKKTTLVISVYFIYLLIWIIVDVLYDYDLDYDVLPDIEFTVLFQIVAFIVNYIKKKLVKTNK